MTYHKLASKMKGGATTNPVSGLLNSITKGALGTTTAAKPASVAAAAKPTVATASAVKKGGKKYKGGDASDWVSSNFGSTVSQQYNNTFGNGGPGNAGNLIPTVHGAKAVGPHNIPQGSSSSYIKSGGRHHRHTRSCGCRSRRPKRGGNYGQVLSAAAVPFGLMGASYLLSRRKRGSSKARTVRRRSRSSSRRRYS